MGMGIDKSRVLVLGRGFLGKEYEKHGYTVWGRDKFDFKNLQRESYHYNQASQILSDVKNSFDVIINCIGCADTRFCEDGKNWGEVFHINSSLPKILSSICLGLGKKFVHISTGCVYDKNNTPQKEDGFLSSHCKYVVSKLCAEFHCDLTRDLVLRPRLYFSGDKDKNNLLCKLPNFTSHLNEINSYTSTRTIVESTTALLSRNQSGIFNVANIGYATIEQIADWIGLDVKSVITGEGLQASQGLALVNNILDVSKLEKFYTPRDIKSEILDCWSQLHN